MRRPRGPGGRFLTAEEIAAQKATAVPTDDIDVDDDQLGLGSPDTESEPHPPTPGASGAYMDYTRQLSPKIFSQGLPPQPQSQPQPVPVQQQQQQQQQLHHHHHRHHHHHKTTLDSIALTPPYSAVQMHHVPHPHAHAREHHSNFAAYTSIFAPEITQQNLDIQRRTDDMMHFASNSSTV